MNYLRPNKQRAKMAMYLIYAILAIRVIALVSDIFQYQLLDAVNNGEQITEEAAEANDSRQLLITIIYAVAYIISAITFISWFRRAYYNLHQKVRHLSQPEGWAAAVWFIPFVNLYQPYKIMDEMWKKTDKLLNIQPATYISKDSNYLVVFWWISWVVALITGGIYNRYSRITDTLENYITLTVISIIFSILLILSAIITISMIKEYSEMEKQLFLLDQNDNGEEIPPVEEEKRAKFDLG